MKFGDSALTAIVSRCLSSLKACHNLITQQISQEYRVLFCTINWVHYHIRSESESHQKLGVEYQIGPHMRFIVQTALLLKLNPRNATIKTKF